MKLLSVIVVLGILAIIGHFGAEEERKKRAKAVHSFFKSMKPYTRKEMGHYWRIYGEKGMKKVTRLRKKAAQRAINTNTCARVVSSELDRKSTKNRKVLTVTCGDNNKVTYREGALIPKKEKKQRQLSPRGDYVTQCANYIRQHAAFPSSVDIHYFLGSSSGQGARGEHIQRLDFDAKNALGVELPYSAYCTFPRGSTSGSITIQRR